MLVLACVAILSACASGRRIDGSSGATFERSVAMLQNDLSSRRRDDFEVALALLWMRTPGVSPADVDGDGDTDYFDMRSMADTAGDLLAAIQRGDLVSTVEASKGESVARAYFAQLDGLGYGEVIELAGEADLGQYLAPVKRGRSGDPCEGQQPGHAHRIPRCD